MVHPFSIFITKMESHLNFEALTSSLRVVNFVLVCYLFVMCCHCCHFCELLLS